MVRQHTLSFTTISHFPTVEDLHSVANSASAHFHIHYHLIHFTTSTFHTPLSLTTFQICRCSYPCYSVLSTATLKLHKRDRRGAALERGVHIWRCICDVGQRATRERMALQGVVRRPLVFWALLGVFLRGAKGRRTLISRRC